MKLIYTPLIFFLLFISNSIFSKSNDEKGVEFDVKNNPPVFSNIPDQVMLGDGTFPDLDLNNYLTEPDGDDIEWDYFFTNTLSNGESVNWDYSNQSPSMTMLAQINIRGEFNDASGDYLAAFHDGEIKGQANAIQVGPNWFFFLTIDGDQPQDSVSFKYFDADQSTVFEVNDTVLFVSQKTYGSPSSPYVMNAGYISVLEEGTPNEGILYPKAYDPNWSGRDTVYIVAREVGTPQNLADTAMVIFKTSGKGLPLELLSFAGKTVGEKSHLHWEIASPENVAGYEIQRTVFNSSSNLDWKYLDFVSHDNSKFHYDFIDELPFRSANYYRLKIIDLDGSYELSPVVSLYFEDFEKTQVNVFPNPVFSNQQFFISIKTEISTDIEIEIIDQTGRLLKSNNFKSEGIRQYFPIEIGELNAGFYLAKINIGHQVFNRSFVIVED